MPFTVTPNPFNDFILIVAADKEYDYVPLNLSGQVVMTGRAKGTLQLNTTDLKNGIYLLRLHSDTQSASFKLLKD